MRMRDHAGAEPDEPAEPERHRTGLGRAILQVRRRPGRYIVIPLLFIALLTWEAFYVVPAWSAKFGSGTRGTFTVGSCERMTCWGTFVSNDGRDTQNWTSIGSSGGRLRLGQQVPAVDTGNPQEVYPAGGGNDWLVFTLLLLCTIFGVGLWIKMGPIEERRDRRRAEAAQARVDATKMRVRPRSIGGPRFESRPLDKTPQDHKQQYYKQRD